MYGKPVIKPISLQYSDKEDVQQAIGVILNADLTKVKIEFIGAWESSIIINLVNIAGYIHKGETKVRKSISIPLNKGIYEGNLIEEDFDFNLIELPKNKDLNRRWVKISFIPKRLRNKDLLIAYDKYPDYKIEITEEELFSKVLYITVDSLKKRNIQIPNNNFIYLLNTTLLVHLPTNLSDEEICELRDSITTELKTIVQPIVGIGDYNGKSNMSFNQKSFQEKISRLKGII